MVLGSPGSSSFPFSTFTDNRRRGLLLHTSIHRMSSSLPSSNPGTVLASSVDEETNKFRSLQETINEMRGGLQTLQSQATENEMVLQELKILTSISDESTTNSGSSAPSAPVVYKLMGPALIRQPIDDALDTVNKRLDFIKSEHGKLSTKIQDHEAKAHIMAKKIQQMQALLQQSTVQAVQAIAAEHQSQQRK